MISSISTTFNSKKISDYVEDGESISEKDIAKVDAEIIQELEELYLDEDEEELI